jgi:hypothetical protein
MSGDLSGSTPRNARVPAVAKRKQNVPAFSLLSRPATMWGNPPVLAQLSPRDLTVSSLSDVALSRSLLTRYDPIATLAYRAARSHRSSADPCNDLRFQVFGQDGYSRSPCRGGSRISAVRTPPRPSARSRSGRGPAEMKIRIGSCGGGREQAAMGGSRCNRAIGIRSTGFGMTRKAAR